MYCPECLVEYRDGFTECADCHKPLSPGLPPPEPGGPLARPPLDDVDLVNVLEVHDTFALRLATATLDDAGISYMIAGDKPGFTMGPMGYAEIGEMPLCNCCSLIQVAREDEKEARELLAPIANPELVPPDE
jgi:hypothetical protein